MKNNKAFTLVELSIVLVIIGLLVGGILAGQSLIRASELRSVISEYQQYQTAVNTFRDKYFALPGDMTNAIAFWNPAHTTPGTCRTTSSTGKETCDGDGDGQIDVSAGSNEYFRFWQHLANAELIAGSFSGISASSGDSSHADRDVVVGTNTPTSKTGGNNTWMAINVCSGSSTCWTNVNYGNVLHFGADINTTGAELTGLALKPEEAWNIDTKIDDGRPGTGKVVARSPRSCAYVAPSSTASSANDTTAEYDVGNIATSGGAGSLDGCDLSFIGGL